MKHFFTLVFIVNLIVSCSPSKKKLPVLGRKEMKNVEFDGKSSYVQTPLIYDGSHPITIEAEQTC